MKRYDVDFWMLILMSVLFCSSIGLMIWALTLNDTPCQKPKQFYMEKPTLEYGLQRLASIRTQNL